jgi:hypothetical protein
MQRGTFDRATETDVEALAPHLIALAGSDWAAWRWVGLRSAGFPAEQVARLAEPAAAAAADAFLQADAQVAQAQQHALRLLERMLQTASAGQHHAALKALQQLRKGRLPQPLMAEPIDRALQRYAEARTHSAAALADFQQTFAAAAARTTATVYDLAQDGRLREALAWQNRQALQRGVASLLRAGPTASRTARQRQNEALVASYLQRYCTKNDTIGFFGPVGWARLSDDRGALAVSPGPQLLATRQVYFDNWGIDALAAQLSADPALRPWLRPRRLPQVDVVGATLYLPQTAPRPLDSSYAAVLRACDGERSARELAAALLNAPGSSISSVEQVYAILDDLCRQRRIAWSLELSIEEPMPEQQLRSQIERIDDVALRTQALEPLDRLIAARDQISAAAGDADRVDQALGLLEAAFSATTGAAATRRPGEVYAGRALVYEDCRRDVDVLIGADCLETLRSPLSLVLQSARWFSHATARAYRAALREVYEAVAQHSRSRTVEFSTFWMWAHALIFGEDTAPIDEVVRTLQQRWAAILALPPDQRRVSYAADQLAAAVAGAFATDDSGWQAARYQCPDLMLAAQGLEAVHRREYLWVLGEVHTSENSLKTALFVRQHPRPDELRQATERDLPAPQVVLVSSRETGGVTSRLSWALTAAKDYRFVYAHDSCGVPPERALPIGALVIEETPEGLMVRTRDGRVRCDVLEILGDLLAVLVQHDFAMLPRRDHLPRVTIDRLVVQRESWYIPADAIDFVMHSDEATRFLGARQWRDAFQMPRRVFVSVATEPKPIHLDFDSLLSVEIVAKAIRAAALSDPAPVKVTEMLPDTNQLWLTDRQGRHYTAEFRLVAVDQARPA